MNFFTVLGILFLFCWLSMIVNHAPVVIIFLYFLISVWLLAWGCDPDNGD